jgi:glycosyltransferase involved in cell wall biosynthesis
MKLSIVIPVFNEEKTVSQVLKKVSEVRIAGVTREIIVVDDGSTDKTVSIVLELRKKLKGIKFIRHDKNMGKGSAVRSGIKNASGDFIVIQDADLEYDPNDIPRLLSFIKEKNDVIYGTRLNRLPNLKDEERRIQFLMHYFGNRFLSFIASVLYGQWITDMETCYKIFPRKQVLQMNLRARRFDFEPEITAKLLKKGLKIREVPIKTNPRGYEEGKKLNTFRDGFVALFTLVKYRFTD